MNLWILEGRTGPNNRSREKWVPLWCAFVQCSGPTRKECLSALRKESGVAAAYVREGIYTKFRAVKYARAE